MTRAEWLALLGLSADDVPRLVVLEGSWWRRERNSQRLALLDDVRELAFPEFHFGRHRGVPVLYSCAYGATRAVEPLHVCGELGTPVVIQIGSCGTLQPGMRTGDIVLPEHASIGEGASQYYGGERSSSATPELVDAADAAFAARGFRVHRGRQFTTSALFAQPPELVAAWRRSGHLAVDMETSAVFSAAHSFGMQAASLLFAWDDLVRRRSWMDPFSPEETDAQNVANAALMEVALELGTRTSAEGHPSPG